MLMDNFVQKVRAKKLLHDSTCAMELTDALLEFIVWDIRLVSAIDSHVKELQWLDCKESILNWSIKHMDW